MGFPPGYRFAVRVAHPGAMTGDHPRRDRSRRASLPWRSPVGRDNGTRSHLHRASARPSYLTSGQMSEASAMRRCLLDAPWTRPGQPHANTLSSPVIHRGISRHGSIHNRHRATRPTRRCPARWCHDLCNPPTQPLQRGLAHLCLRRRTAYCHDSARRSSLAPRTVAMAHGRAGARRRRIRPTCPRLASRAPRSDVAIPGTIPGVRVRFRDRDDRRSRRGPGRHLDSSRRRWRRRLVDVSARDAIRCRWRSCRERGRHWRRRRGFTHAALGRENRQTYVHRSDTYDARASAASPLGRRAGSVAVPE